MSKINRRESLQILAAVPAAASFTWTETEVRQVQEARKSAAGSSEAPRFFSESEWQTVRILCDLVLPADDRSAGAVEAGVPEFIDFMMNDDEVAGRTERQVAVRGGLAWVDYRSIRRFGGRFAQLGDPQRRQILDEIAWPETAAAEVSQGVAFFNSFRDLVATGFWSSKIGIEDLDYRGNRFVPEWTGCPDEALRHLQVEFED
ncbi:MAG: gluconate 2-dehydrogenase subunit 3 family protein [Acidobacteriota bacterium]